MRLILASLLLLSACNGGSPGTQSDPEKQWNGPLVGYSTGYLKNPKAKYGRTYWQPNSLYNRRGLLPDGSGRAPTIPDEWDWRAKGKKIPILSQGNCGSCWAFGSVETEIASALIFQGKVLALSPQEIVSYDTENYGCSGGNYAKHFMETFGAVLESDCPYTASNRKCRPDPTKLTPAFKASSVVFIGQPDRSPTFDEVRSYIYQYGYVGVSAGADSAWTAKSAVIPQCNGTEVNHEVAAFAYSVSRKSIKIQNSWGKDIGDPADPGTMELPWGCDNLAFDAGAVVPAAAPCQPPKLSLPKEVVITNGTSLTLAVKAEEGVTYAWDHDGTPIGTGAVITFNPTASGDVQVTATSSCGTAQMKTFLSIQ